MCVCGNVGQPGERNMKRHQTKLAGLKARQWDQRRGVIVVLTAFLITVLFAFMALSVDTGRVVLTETQMQNAVDAASLAASEEITSAVYKAGQGQGSANIDANSIAVSSARAMAADVAKRNGVYVNPSTDVQFGKRVFDTNSGQWTTQWNASPYSVVKVSARRTNSDLTAQDGQFPLAFGWAVGKSSIPLTTSSTAFVEARDLVLVLDYSASMDDDSSLVSTYRERSQYGARCTFGPRSAQPTRNGQEPPPRNFRPPVSAASTPLSAPTSPAPTPRPS